MAEDTLFDIDAG
jgi:hypothetical protein